MTTVITYYADDGKYFEDENECLEYEFENSIKHWDEIIILDENGNRMTDMFDDRTYNNADSVDIKTNEAYQDLLKVAEYNGWTEFEYIPCEGLWRYTPASPWIPVD